MNDNLRDIKHVAEVHSAEDCQMYLSLGWELLGVATVKCDDGEYIMYSVGWGSISDPKYPKSKFMELK